MSKRKAKADPRTPLTVGKLLRMLTRIDPATPVLIGKACGFDHAIVEFSGARAGEGEAGAKTLVLLVASAEVTE